MSSAEMPVEEGRRREDVSAVFLLALIALALFSWERDLFDADEGRYASVAAAMADSGDYVTPRLNGMPFMDKPPLVYWVQASLFERLGRSEILARLPTIFSGALWALFVFLFARAWSGSRRAAWLAAFLAVTSAAGMIGSRVGPQMDMPLAAAVAGALWAGWRGIVSGGPVPALGLGTAVGLGLLIKGPLVVVIPFIVACTWMLAGVAPRRVLRTAFSPWAWGTAILIAAPWYVLVERVNPGWIAHFINYEHLGRFSTGDYRAFHPFWLYVPIALIYMAPWTSLAWSGWGGASRGAPFLRKLPGVFTWSPWSHRPFAAALPEEAAIGRHGTNVKLARLAWLWFLAAFVLYSLSTRKLLNYLLPAAAPLFVLLGAQLDRRLRAGMDTPWRLPLLLAAAFVVGGVLILAGLFFPFRTGALPSSIEAPRWAPMGGWIVAAGLLLAGAVIASARLRQANWKAACLVAGGLLAWWSVELGLARVSRVGSAAHLAEVLGTHRDAVDTYVAYKRYPQGLGFYGFDGIWMAGGTPEKWRHREIVNPYARRAWEALPRGQDGLPRLGTGRVGPLTDEEFERLWRSEEVTVGLICRWAEIAPLGARVLYGPVAGAGRTDLYFVANHPRRRSGDR